VTILLVALGAAVGAPLRYLVDRFIQARYDTVFPWGTLSVNLTGSFLLGALAGSVPGPWLALLGTGFCGALTTYSTFGYETIRLVQQRATGYALLNVLVSVVAGLSAALAGAALAGS
jgi:CrcB protein